jgi:hypothetical protein
VQPEHGAGGRECRFPLPRQRVQAAHDQQNGERTYAQSQSRDGERTRAKQRVASEYRGRSDRDLCTEQSKIRDERNVLFALPSAWKADENSARNSLAMRSALFFVRSALFFVAFVLALTPAMPPASSQTAPPSGLAYDEIQKHFVGVRPEGPGHFSDDLAAIEAQAPPANPATGDDPADEAVEAGPATLESVNGPGRLFHFAFLGDVWRVDDPIAQTATITTPSEVIRLDLRRKTYVRLTGDAARAAIQSRTVFGDALRALTSASAPATNTVLLDLEQHFDTLPAKKLDGISAPGVRLAQLVQPISHSKSCSVAYRFVAYVMKYYDPRYAEHPLYAAEAGSENARLFTSVHVPGCRVSYRKRTIDAGAEPGSGRLALYRSYTTIVQQQPSGASGPSLLVTTALVERANVHDLGAQDASLFEVPPGYAPEASTSATGNAPETSTSATGNAPSTQSPATPAPIAPAATPQPLASPPAPSSSPA